MTANDQPEPTEEERRTAEFAAELERAHEHDFANPAGTCSCGAQLVQGEGGKLDVAHPAEGYGEMLGDDLEQLQQGRAELAEHAGETEAADLADRAVAVTDQVLEDAGELPTPPASTQQTADYDALFHAQGYVVMQAAVKQAAQGVGQLPPDTIRAVIDATFKAIQQAKVAGDRRAEVSLTTDLAAYRAMLRFRTELTKVDESQATRARLLGLDGPPQNGEVPPPGLPR